jgi:AcrR family transcriptional regulator
VLKAAAHELRAHGFDGVGVDRLSAAAGVTSGAFYSHFGSKEELLAAVIDAHLGQPFAAAGEADPATRRKRLRAYLRNYISLHHRDGPGDGCVIPTLSADVARAGPAVRTVYQERMIAFMGKIAGLLAGPPAAREKNAWTLLSLMVGALVIARAMPDKAQATKVIEAALESALETVGA